MKKQEAGIYATHGKETLLAVKAKVNGVLSLAYVKNGELVSYEPWDNINRQMYTGKYMEFVTDN